MWPQEAGIRPYKSGNGDQVIKVNWREGSVFSPPTGWFHQHFNTGKERRGSWRSAIAASPGSIFFGVWKAINKEGVRTSIREGGTLIEYEDEDPQIRKDFEAAIDKVAVLTEMPDFQYAEL